MEKIRIYDEEFMRRCIELSKEAVEAGDEAFGSVVTIGHEFIAEGRNNYRTRVSEHAEIVALNNAHQVLGTHDLSECTLYTSCEPCPMCAFMIRVFKVKRVVFALPSVHVGGYSKWPILQDPHLSNLRPVFGEPPEVLGGLLEHEAGLVMSETCLWMFGNDPEGKG